MITLNIVLSIFILLEISNFLTLYFNPTLKQANAVGIFKSWEDSKKDPQMHDFVQYLVYWVAGTKLIFLTLLIVILFLAGPDLKVIAVVGLVISILSFYWKMFPLIKKMDNKGMIIPSGYSKQLGLTIRIFVLALSLSVIVAYFSLI